MKKNLYLLLCAFLAFGLTTGAALAQADAKPASPAKTKAPAKAPARYFEKLAFPPLNKIVSPTVDSYILPNGLKVFLCEDHEFPKINFSALVRGGELASPDKASLAGLFGDVLRSGGTQTMNGDKADEYLENIGASIYSNAGMDSIALGGSTLAENREAVLALFADFLRTPGLTADKLDLSKVQSRSGISRRNDNVQGVAQREFQKLLFGPKSPYGRQEEYDDVNAVTREDLVAYHKRFFRPDFTTIAVWGDFKAAEMKALLEKLFGGWKADGPAPKVVLPEIPKIKGSVNYIEKKDVKQTFLLFGLPGLRYDDADYPAVRVMTDLLGGGFASRIFKTVRTEKGLAYGAGGAIVPAYDHPGSFYFYTSTKPQSTAEAISAVLGELKKIAEAPPTEAELAYAKNAYLNAYAFEYDDPAEVVRRLVTYDFYGYPRDFNEKVRTLVEKVTLADVQRVAQKYLRPEALTLLAVGKADEFDKPLSTFGTVNTIDITIPAPKSTEVVAEATPESLAKGTALLKKAAAAKGEKAMLELKTSVVKGKANRSLSGMAMKLDVKSSYAYPDRLAIEMTLPMGTVKVTLVGDTGWMAFGPSTMPIGEAELNELKTALYTELGCARLLREALEGKLKGQFTGEKTFNGVKAGEVLLKINGKDLFVYVSPDTFEVLGTKGIARTEKGPAMTMDVYSDFQDFGGLKVPLVSKQLQDNQEISSIALSEVVLNPELDPKLFDKPQVEGEVESK